MKLSDYLERERITSAQFARDCGVLKQSMFKYVHDLAIPSARTLAVIKEKSNGDVTADDFVEARNARERHMIGSSERAA